MKIVTMNVRTAVANPVISILDGSEVQDKSAQWLSLNLERLQTEGS